jgi:hypothetical protein
MSRAKFYQEEARINDGFPVRKRIYGKDPEDGGYGGASPPSGVAISPIDKGKGKIYSERNNDGAVKYEHNDEEEI